MKKAFKIVLVVLIIVSVSFGGLLVANQNSPESRENPKAYVGVAYCGNTVADGKMLIDRVKGYSNLFVLQSGLLQRDLKSVDELGDYAVAAGMFFLPYFGNFVQETFSVWLESAEQKWGERFLGVYYADEAGGKMLDDYVEYRDTATGNVITKTKYGDLFVKQPNGIMINYSFDGAIHLYEPAGNSDINSEATFYPNGTNKIIKPAVNGFSYQTYQQLQNIRPFKDIDETAQRFYDRDQSNIQFLKNRTKIFTSDYALHWFDYISGYDVVLGQIGWNLTLNQQIALLRGASKIQNKDWGVVITWKYQQPPYLDNGTEILNQMRTAYECGAKYFVLFNYYDSNDNPYGTMQKEHFQALESFWNNVVRNTQIIHGAVSADSVLVLPKNYGWGMRWKEDKIWGIFRSEEKTGQIWGLLQITLQEHSLKLDIIYDQEKSRLPSEYENRYFCHNGVQER